MSSTHNPDSGLPSGPESGSPKESQSQPLPSSFAPTDPPKPENTPNESPMDTAQPTTNGEQTAAASEPTDQDESHIESGDQKDVSPAVEKMSESSDVKEMEDSGPSLVITLLLITGARHPFKIDGKYLRKRSVNVDNHDPFAMSVYTLKELIWREWRSGKIYLAREPTALTLTFIDWETRPASPSSIRLISFGKLLEDKSPLAGMCAQPSAWFVLTAPDSKFSCDAPNVVHMTVKPQEMIDEEDAKGAKAQYNRDREPNERSPGCRCIIL